MMKELRARGPYAISFKVPATFGYYDGGVFQDHDFFSKTAKLSMLQYALNTTLFQRNIQWEELSHAVSLVGYGETTDEETGKTLKYWTLQNSWGS